MRAFRRCATSLGWQAPLWQGPAPKAATDRFHKLDPPDTDVSFYLTEESGNSDNISISAQSIVELSAPWDGENPGVLFYQDRNSPANISHNFTGGASFSLEGIMYFPNQHLKFSGGTEIDPVTSLIVADSIEFTGHTQVADLDGSAIFANPNLITVSLVE